MKKIDIDMIIISGFSLIFSMFLLDNNQVNTSRFNVIKSNSNVVTIYRNDRPIDLDFNDYLVGVVGCEVDASFDVEALKTQAIVARTYALRKISKNDKLTDDVNTQCYKDKDELKEKWGKHYNEYYEKIKKVVDDTNELAIYYNNDLIDAVYHSLSNGYTEDAKEVWGSDIPYLVSVESTWDKEDKNYKNTILKTKDEFLKILGVNSINYILNRDKSNRVINIIVDNKEFSGVEFRKLLGLKSTDFEIDVNNDVVTITTYGYGHGVGLSQEGANYLAKKGYKFDEIIKYYYKDVEIKSIM